MEILAIILFSFIIGGEVEHHLSQPEPPKVEIILKDDVKVDRTIDKDHTK